MNGGDWVDGEKKFCLYGGICDIVFRLIICYFCVHSQELFQSFNLQLIKYYITSNINSFIALQSQSKQVPTYPKSFITQNNPINMQNQSTLLNQNTINKQTIFNLFKISNPLSLNNKSIYRQDYQSLLDNNWLRTQALSSLITIIQKQFHQKIILLIETQIQPQNNIKEGQKTLKETLRQNFMHHVKIIDPFVVTMIISTQQDFILQTLQGLEIFNSKTKYILFPMNTDHGKGNHWFLTIFKNPRYNQLRTKDTITFNTQSHRKQEPQLFILNSIPTSKHDSSIYMANQLSQQIIRLLKMFHYEQKFDKITKFPIHRLQKVTYQSNSYDCGIFTVGFIEKFLMQRVFEYQIEHLVKMRAWQIAQSSQKEQKKQQRGLNPKVQFIILKPSSLLRKIYRQKLQLEIFTQNISLIQ